MHIRGINRESYVVVIDGEGTFVHLQDTLFADLVVDCAYNIRAVQEAEREVDIACPDGEIVGEDPQAMV